MQTSHFDAVIAAPFGAIGVQVKNDFLTRVELMSIPQITHISPDPFVMTVVSQIQAYLQNPLATIDLPCAIQGTPFQKRVWCAISSIPSGKVITYGELAESVSSGPRAVANVCGANQVPLVIPCHRIVAKSGLGGFMQGKENGLLVKEWLLAHESAKY